MSSWAEGPGQVALSVPPNWPPPPQPGRGRPNPQPQEGQNWPPPGQGGPQQGQQWPPPGQNPPPRRSWPPPAPQNQSQYAPQHQSQYAPQPPWGRDPRPTRPAVLTAARIVVMIPSGIWLFSLLMIWMFQSSFSESVLGPIVDTFILGLAAGDWAPMVLLPVAGCALTITMGTGHAIDRWMFTAAAVLWAVWYWQNVHFVLTPNWLAGALVIAALLCVWTSPYKDWIKAVESWEMRRAAPPADARQGRQAGPQ